MSLHVLIFPKPVRMNMRAVRLCPSDCTILRPYTGMQVDRQAGLLASSLIAWDVELFVCWASEKGTTFTGVGRFGNVFLNPFRKLLLRWRRCNGMKDAAAADRSTPLRPNPSVVSRRVVVQ